MQPKGPSSVSVALNGLRCLKFVPRHYQICQRLANLQCCQKTAPTRIMTPLPQHIDETDDLKDLYGDWDYEGVIPVPTQDFGFLVMAA